MAKILFIGDPAFFGMLILMLEQRGGDLTVSEESSPAGIDKLLKEGFDLTVVDLGEVEKGAEIGGMLAGVESLVFAPHRSDLGMWGIDGTKEFEPPYFLPSYTPLSQIVSVIDLIMARAPGVPL